MLWVLVVSILVLLTLLLLIERTLANLLEQLITVNRKLRESNEYLCRMENNTTYLRYEYNENHPDMHAQNDESYDTN